MLLPTLLLTAALPAAFAATPVPPILTHLFSVNLTFSAPITIGSVPYGSRDLLFISGGTFAGPKLSGTQPSPELTSTFKGLVVLIARDMGDTGKAIQQSP